MITDLRNPTLKTRHWEVIEQELDHHFTEEDPLTLGKLIEIDAFEHTEVIQEISGQASSEASLESILKKVTEKFFVHFVCVVLQRNILALRIKIRSDWIRLEQFVFHCG